VNFAHLGDTLTTATLSGNLTFIMDTNIAANASAGDQDIFNVNSDCIVVTGPATGEHVIVVRDESVVTGNEYALWLVQTGESESAATFTGSKQKIQGVNLLTYKVMNGDDANDLLAGKNAGYQVGGDANDWYLLLAKSEIRPDIEPAVDSSLALHVIWFAEMDSLLKRMGQLKKTALASREKEVTSGAGKKMTSKLVVIPGERPLVENIWVRGYGAQYNMQGSVSGSPFKQTLYGTDFGLDHAWDSDNMENMYWLGAFGGYGRAQQDHRRQRGKAQGDSYYGGIYGSWLNDEGWYADVVGKVSWFKNGFDAWAADAKTTGDYNNWAAGISLEAGRQYKNDKGWFAEPQMQGSYVHFFGADYTAKGDSPFKVNAGAADVFQLRYGSLFGRTYEGDAGDFWQPYMKVFGQHQFSHGGRVRIEDHQWRPNLDGVSFIIGAGVIWQINESNQLHLDYEAGFARKYTKPWGVNAGFSHKF